MTNFNDARITLRAWPFKVISRSPISRIFKKSIFFLIFFHLSHHKSMKINKTSSGHFMCVKYMYFLTIWAKDEENWMGTSIVPQHIHFPVFSQLWAFWSERGAFQPSYLKKTQKLWISVSCLVLFSTFAMSMCNLEPISPWVNYCPPTCFKHCLLAAVIFET